MSPFASAKRVLFDEFACSSITCSNAPRSAAFVRVYDCVSAATGRFMRLTLTQYWPCRRTTGPCFVKYAVNVRFAMPAFVR